MKAVRREHGAPITTGAGAQRFLSIFRIVVVSLIS
jgi:hypothetical protein